MEKFVPVVVIKELGETDKILTALKNNAEPQARTDSAGGVRVLWPNEEPGTER